MSKKQKQIALIAGSLVLLYLAYRHFAGASTSTAGVAAPDTSGSDFAALAGQEQGDVAQLQQDLAQLDSQEQADIGAATGQEQSDIAGIEGQIGEILSAIAGIGSSSGSGGSVPGQGTGTTQGTRTTKKITKDTPIGAPAGVKQIKSGFGSGGIAAKSVAHPNGDHAQKGGHFSPSKPKKKQQPKKPPANVIAKKSGVRG